MKLITLPYRPNVPFSISDIRALWPAAECQSAWMSEIENGALGLYGAKHSKCNRTMTLGFKGLSEPPIMEKFLWLNNWVLKLD